jgi:hypothetical protein
MKPLHSKGFVKIANYDNQNTPGRQQNQSQKRNKGKRR